MLYGCCPYHCISYHAGFKRLLQETPSREVEQAILSCLARGQMKSLTIRGWTPVHQAFRDLMEWSDAITRSSLNQFTDVDIRRDGDIVCHAGYNMGMDSAGLMNQFLLCQYMST
jgi:hypothetical protein